jgi:hypothetical protein
MAEEPVGNTPLRKSRPPTRMQGRTLRYNGHANVPSEIIGVCQFSQSEKFVGI